MCDNVNNVSIVHECCRGIAAVFAFNSHGELPSYIDLDIQGCAALKACY